MTPLTLLVRQAGKVYTDGDPDFKVAATGFAVLAAGISETATSLLAAVMVFFWFLDMISGAARAIAIGGLSAFTTPKFYGGFLKLLAAACGIGVGVGTDLLIADLGLDKHYISTAALAIVTIGFGSSAAQNVAHWWPSLAALLERGLGRARDTQPTDGHD